MPSTFDTRGYRRAVIVLLSALVVIEFLRFADGDVSLTTVLVVLLGSGLLSGVLQFVFAADSDPE